MELSEVESQIMDVLTIHSPEWRINPDIAIQIGRMHNYVSKLLAQLITKGLAESRYVEENGDKMPYKEYRLKRTEKPVKTSEPSNTIIHTEPEKPANSPTPTHIDRINRGISPENVRNLIERCETVLRGYPEGTEKENIKIQITELESR